MCHSHCLSQDIPDVPGLGTIKHQHPVELCNIGAHLLKFSRLRIVRTVCGADEETENKGSHRRDKAHHEPHGLLGIAIDVAAWQLDQQPGQRSGNAADEDKACYGNLAHSISPGGMLPRFGAALGRTAI
jgi:hypothetical protein